MQSGGCPGLGAAEIRSMTFRNTALHTYGPKLPGSRLMAAAELTCRQETSCHATAGAQDSRTCTVGWHGTKWRQPLREGASIHQRGDSFTPRSEEHTSELQSLRHLV